MKRKIIIFTITLVTILMTGIVASANNGGSTQTGLVADGAVAYASPSEIDTIQDSSFDLSAGLLADSGSVNYFGATFASVVANTAPCLSYYGRGYCTDYIQRRTGRRQSGDAGRWQGNFPVTQGRGGDVAIFTYPAPFGHVAYIVRPVYAHNTANLIAYDIEEWNYGPQWVNRTCGVTNKFGVVTSRRIAVSAVSRIWRP